MSILDGRDEEHIAWEKRLGHIANATEQWQKSLQREPPAIEPTSDLAGDDADFAGFSVSNLVGYSLASATEHLDFTLTVMKQTSTLYPTAYMTVLRTSLLAASHAAWILIPDDRVMRQTRALEFLADDMRTQLTMVRDAFAGNDTAKQAKSKMIALLLERQEQLQPIADALKPELQIAKHRINNTTIIETVAQAAHDEQLTRSGVNMIWRSASAAAHGSRSFATMRLNQNQIIDTGPGGKYSLLRGDLVNDIGPAAAAASLALNFAIKVFNQRRTSPKP